MSTIKVNNLQDAGGGSNSTPAQIEQGRAKAWVNFNGTGTVSIRDDYNVSSITDNATGSYTVNLSTAMSNADYCCASQTWGIGFDNEPLVLIGYPQTTSAFLIIIKEASTYSANFDSTYVLAAIFGDS